MASGFTKIASLSDIILTMRRIQFLGMIGLSLTLTLTGYLAASLSHTPHAKAAGVITVNSNNDTTANDGVCTLREAIVAANNDTASGAAGGECAAGSDTDTINFSITGTASFTNDGQSGYTITPATALPFISTPMTINGYSQPGARANTAIAPQPLNGRLLIQLDGNDGDFHGLQMADGSDGSVIAGLVIGRFKQAAIYTLGADNTSIHGNYLGTDPTGMVARPIGEDTPNLPTIIGVGSTASPVTDPNTTNTHIGSVNPADRNIISNGWGGGIGIYAVDTTVQGNYIGLAADGVTAMGNSQATGNTTGGLTIDYADGVLLGGDEQGAANVISDNRHGGVQPDGTTRITIVGNYIGTDYTGVLDRGNGDAGISFATQSPGSLTTNTSIVRHNIVKFNDSNGISINDEPLDSFIIEGNIAEQNGICGIELAARNGDDVSTRVIGNTVRNNTCGVKIGQTNAVVGGTQASERNIISGNQTTNINIVAFSLAGLTAENMRIQGNYIGTNDSGQIDNAITQGFGIEIKGDPTNVLIGGAQAGAGNIIAGNSDYGVGIPSIDLPAYSALLASQNISILGNSIFGNKVGSVLPVPNGLGIDLYATTDNEPDGTIDNYEEVGPTVNDAGDSDVGSNHYTNYPTLHAADQVGTTLNLTYDLDAADSPSNTYRIEFFANDTADPSGYGEDQTFLGAITSINGIDRSAALTLPSGLNLSGKSISATTTAIDSTVTSGFGSTSEFSPVLTASYTAAGLADTGENIWTFVVGASALILLAGGITLTHRRFLSKGFLD